MKWRAVWEAASRYRGSPQLFGYALGKAAADPAYPFVAARLSHSPLPVLDIGCGAGHLTSYLRACGHRAPILGLDPDESKIATAQRVFPADGCRFAVGSAGELPAHVGNVIMLDVLHYLPRDVHPTVLAAIASRLSGGSEALVRTTLRDSSRRFLASRWEEAFIRAVRWIPYPPAHYPTKSELLAILVQLEVEWELLPMWGLTPFNSYMLRIWRRTSSAGT
jgi:2-polyprenyl-3-methyl-5-hydroxy-6-metoxy-1,4-benzoquinol methylase